MRLPPLLTAVAAAGFLASGCDYWRNLVDESTVATAHLKVKVVDAYTHEHIVATCADSGRGLVLQTSYEDGEADTLNAGTGMYTIQCHAQSWYYDKTIAFPLTPAGDTVIFGLARLGGEANWYKDHPTREVRIREKFDTLRFPGNFDFNAYPEDTLKPTRFRYEWAFSKAKGLGREIHSTNAVFHYLRNRAELENAVPGPDTLTLSVWSYLNDPKVPYLIGMDKRPFVWVRNRLPKLTMTSVTEALILVGCPESQPLRINFSAEDPDGEGECKSVRFHTFDTTSTFGAVDTTFSCDPGNILFYLKNKFAHLRSDSAWVRERNELRITVTDKNDESFETSVTIRTRTNILPTLVSEIENSRKHAFTDDPINVIFEATDLDNPPDKFTIHWGADDTMELDIKNSTENTWRDTVTRSFDTPGRKDIHVKVTDECNGVASHHAGSILIRENSNPEVNFTYFLPEVEGDSVVHIFKIKAEDKDIKDGLDDMITRVNVDWGDNTPHFSAYPDINGFYSEKISHHFGSAPDSLGRYRIIVSVFDLRDGVGRDTLYFP